MRNIIVGVGVVGVASIIVVACSSSDSDTNPTDTKTSPAESSDASPAPSSTPTNPAPPPPPPPSTCSNAQGEEPCFDCCDAKNPGGAEIFDQAMRTCACAEDVCATQCAESACAETPLEPVAGDECSECMAGAIACGEQAHTACIANAACARLSDCLDKNGCIPEEDGGT